MDFADKVLADLVARMRALESEIESRIAERRTRFHYAVERNRIRFEHDFLAAHRAFRQGLWQQLRHSPLPFILVSPVIYSLIVPLALLDLFLALYQALCFPVYGIRRVPRSEFIVIDSVPLAYLNPLEKLNCLYCSYANGLIALAREVAAHTEEFWCPIKRSRPIRAPHSRYVHFVDYGDAEGYRRHREQLRDHAKVPDDPPPKA
ncbi:MAG: hypothetical protein HQL33_00965 [Alphaproteobacteria bacterium]|nr:hypothetical protein [Alphaproteobacteria bacterium]MBF0128537.1 hypothetical protein [Alphaproteobacteria bacterium]